MNLRKVAVTNIGTNDKLVGYNVAATGMITASVDYICDLDIV